jgi:hypothetical protein
MFSLEDRSQTETVPDAPEFLENTLKARFPSGLIYKINPSASPAGCLVMDNHNYKLEGGGGTML